MGQWDLDDVKKEFNALRTDIIEEVARYGSNSPLIIEEAQSNLVVKSSKLMLEKLVDSVFARKWNPKQLAVFEPIKNIGDQFKFHAITDAKILRDVGTDKLEDIIGLSAWVLSGGSDEQQILLPEKSTSVANNQIDEPVDSLKEQIASTILTKTPSIENLHNFNPSEYMNLIY